MVDKQKDPTIVPQMRLPNSKMAMLVRYTAFTGKYLKAFPQTPWPAATVRKRAEAYHPTSFRLWNSSVIIGIAVEMMVQKVCVSNTLNRSTCSPYQI